MQPELLDCIAATLVCLKALLYVLAAIFVVFGLDEFFIDIISLCCNLHKKYILLTRPRLSEGQLFANPEQRIALMIPCWDESAVIRKMLDNTIKVLSYNNYVIFVGTYPNDPATQREVALLRETYTHVERVICPKDGPTSKADCLNWVFEGIRLYEKQHSVRFEIIVMDDSEDILHPWAFKLYNHMLPRMDMIQLPVFPMEPQHWYQFTPGHYLDEFAESHSRDMIVREKLTGVVPSAGVATAFSRSILEKLAAANNGQIFTIGSMTEDYDLGLRMSELGARAIFVRNVPVRREGGKEQESRSMLRLRRNYIANRGYFPDTFRAAVRQKGRWVVGIALQGWERMGWKGSWLHKYMLFRDRKSLVTNMVNMVANVLVPVLSFLWLYPLLVPESYRFPPLVEQNSLLWWMLYCNLVLFCWRIVLRAFYVGDVYGLGQAVLSVPRLVWANVINFFATMRALKLFITYLWTGKPIAWDKTDHVFPNEDELLAYRQRLGDMLMDRRMISVEKLESAMLRQKKTGQRLGEVLVELGFIDPRDLAQVLAMQSGQSIVAASPAPRLGDILLDRRLLTAIQLDIAMARQKETGQRLGEVIAQMGLATQQDIEACIVRQREVLSAAGMPSMSA